MVTNHSSLPRTEGFPSVHDIALSASNRYSSEQTVGHPTCFPSFIHSSSPPGEHMFLGGSWIKSRPGTMSQCSYNPCSIWIQDPDIQADAFFYLGNAISGTLLALSSPALSRKLKFSLRRLVCIRLDIRVSSSNSFPQGSFYIMDMAGLLLYSVGTPYIQRYLNSLTRQLVNTLVHSTPMTSRGWCCLTPQSTTPAPYQGPAIYCMLVTFFLPSSLPLSFWVKFLLKSSNMVWLSYREILKDVSFFNSQSRKQRGLLYLWRLGVSSEVILKIPGEKKNKKQNWRKLRPLVLLWFPSKLGHEQ